MKEGKAWKGKDGDEANVNKGGCTFNEGRTEGRKDGRKDGRTERRKEGRKEGRKKGRKYPKEREQGTNVRALVSLDRPVHEEWGGKLDNHG